MGDPTRLKVELDLGKLTYGQVKRVMEHYEALVQVMVANNNAVLAGLAACPDTTNAHIDILNRWSHFNNDQCAAHASAIEAILVEVRAGMADTAAGRASLH